MLKESDKKGHFLSDSFLKLSGKEKNSLYLQSFFAESSLFSSVGRAIHS